jgi:hypothetical protein
MTELVDPAPKEMTVLLRDADHPDGTEWLKEMVDAPKYGGSLFVTSTIYVRVEPATDSWESGVNVAVGFIR